MWDRPALLNRLADALLVAALVLMLYAAARFVVHQPVFPLREVRVSNALTHVSNEEIEHLVSRELRGNFFSLDLAATRTAFEKLPWVREARLRRHWPGRLEVTLEEHAPLARWGNVALVNTHGEVFDAAYDGELPVFLGPSGSAREITIQYQNFRRSLAAIGKAPIQVQVSARRAWQVRLEGGPTLELGREQIETRLARFVTAYDRTLGKLDRRIDYVDLRYGDGFAARIPELRFDKPDPAERRDGQRRKRT